MKVNEFLKNAKNLYNQIIKASFVIGNQSADLDSIVSSISMSYYLSKLNTSSTYIPVINSTRSIINSKKECLHLFEHLSISLDDLLFISEWNPEKINELYLVDHNELEESLKSLNLSELVVGIVDHHVDKRLFTSANPRIVDISVGSNATLVAELIYKSKIELDSSFASMLLFPILSDTNNLTRRANQKDFEMVEYLQGMTDLDLDKTYQKIEELKFGDGQVEDTASMLKKDYKQYENDGKKWGMSSVNVCVNNWLDKNGEKHLKEINEYMQEKGLYFFGVLSCFKTETPGEFRRDLAIFGGSEIMDFSDAKLKFLKKLNVDKHVQGVLYDVSDVSLTRKYWQPVLEKFLKN